MSGRHLVLIGMPGCGKSTVGRAAAKQLGWAFLDVDHEIERAAGMPLRDIKAAEGYDGLQRREREACLAVAPVEPTVVAPGGSVCYDADAMVHLRAIGHVVFLEVPPDELERRAGDLVERGVLIRPGMTYRDLIAERVPLYRRYADATVDCGHADAGELAKRLEALLRE